MTSTELVKQCFQICLWIPLTIVKSLLLISSLLKIRIPALTFNCSYATSVINKIQDPLTVCGFHLHLRFPLTFAEKMTNKCADKIYVTIICTRNPWKFCKWNPLTFSNMFLEPKNIQTHNCATIQSTFWHRKFIMFDPFWKNMISYG